MTVVLGLLIALPSRAEDLAAEKAVTKERMLQVYQAIQEYRKEHKELPASLGDEPAEAGEEKAEKKAVKKAAPKAKPPKEAAPKAPKGQTVKKGGSTTRTPRKAGGA